MTWHDPMVRFFHMRDFARKAMKLVENKTLADLKTDEVLCLALTYLITLLGEAAGKVPPETREKYPRIPWLKIVHMRNRLIHGYDSIDNDILWDTIKTNLPELLSELKAILHTEE